MIEDARALGAAITRYRLVLRRERDRPAGHSFLSRRPVIGAITHAPSITIRAQSTIENRAHAQRGSRPVMSGRNAARVSEIDPVAAAVANAAEDEHEVTAAELEALRQARADKQTFVSGATVTARITERSQRDE